MVTAVKSTAKISQEIERLTKRIRLRWSAAERFCRRQTAESKLQRLLIKLEAVAHVTTGAR